MEKLMNRIMSIGIVFLSLSGLIACSKMEALKPASSISIGGIPSGEHINDILNVSSYSNNDAIMYGILYSIPALRDELNAIAGPLRSLSYRISLDINELTNSQPNAKMVLEVDIPDLGKQVYFKSTAAEEIEVAPGVYQSSYELTYAFDNTIVIYVTLEPSGVTLEPSWTVLLTGSYLGTDGSYYGGTIGSVIALDSQIR